MKKRQKIYCFFKRIISIFGSFLGIILLGLVMIIVAIIIKLTSKGPVLFKQQRIGKNKRVFKIYKFRSMNVGVPEIPPSEMSEEEQKAYTYKFGSFLRKTSLDELPQLFNILKGDMAFIGPRPGAANNEQELQDARDAQDPSPYLVKPGLSGYAQIHLKRDHDIYKKAELDSYYVKNLSFWLDVKIFFYSILVAFGFAKGR